MNLAHHSDILLWLGLGTGNRLEHHLQRLTQTLGVSAYVLFSVQSRPPPVQAPSAEAPLHPPPPSVDDLASIHLYDLTRHPNQKIASTYGRGTSTAFANKNSASRILCRRALNDPVTRHAIHEDAHSKSVGIRSRAEKAISLIRSFDGAAFIGHEDYHSCVVNSGHDDAGSRLNGECRRPENLIEYWDRQPREQEQDTGVNGRTDLTTARSSAPRARNRNGSPRERARRRRRREAIVLNEGDHPVSQQDIIQRQQTQ
jgi:hypothetical protein